MDLLLILNAAFNSPSLLFAVEINCATIVFSSPFFFKKKLASGISTFQPDGVVNSNFPSTLSSFAFTTNVISLLVTSLNTNTGSEISTVAKGKISNGRYTSPLTGSVCL